MQKLKKQKYLFELEPKLVREWHPSANGNLTPRNITIAYPEKLWWLCKEGHEWQATIKCRIERHGCPVCDKETVQKEPEAFISVKMHERDNKKNFLIKENPNINFEGVYPYIGKNFRRNRRFKCKAISVLEVPDSGHWLYAEMINISGSGFSFETEAELKPGAIIKVQVDGAVISYKKERYKSFKTIIRWCKKLDNDQSISNYGIGVEIIPSGT
jgi:hypothetical protein